MSVTAELECFIVDEIALGREVGTIGVDEDLLARGLIDSLGVSQLVAFLEDRFGVHVSDADLTPENFQSLARMEAFVARKRSTAVAP
jgi:acyl carrier protein